MSWQKVGGKGTVEPKGELVTVTSDLSVFLLRGVRTSPHEDFDGVLEWVCYHDISCTGKKGTFRNMGPSMEDWEFCTIQNTLYL